MSPFSTRGRSRHRSSRAAASGSETYSSCCGPRQIDRRHLPPQGAAGHGLGKQILCVGRKQPRRVLIVGALVSGMAAVLLILAVSSHDLLIYLGATAAAGGGLQPTVRRQFACDKT